MFINEQTWEFVRQHAEDDVRQLALQGAKDGETDLTVALRQIAGRQTARRKLPSWAAVEGIIYPPHLNMEQCSSEQTARYKAELAGEGQTFIDLTGGFGVDFYWMSQGFRERYYVEQNAELCDIAEHNFHLLSHTCTVVCGSAADCLSQMHHVSVIFLDPARRNEHGGRTYGIADCTPNVLELLPLLLEKGGQVILKLSPMLDWRKAVSDIEAAAHHPSPVTHEVHIVSVDNECKELLLVLQRQEAQTLRLCCVNNDSRFEVVWSLQTGCLKPSSGAFEASKQSVCSTDMPSPAFLYEPNASIMKAGCFAEVEQRFAVRQLSANSHLFVSAGETAGFPGRRFRIEAVTTMNKRELKEALGGMERANIAVRNFPMTAEELRRKLKLKDGGDVFIFATTVQNNQHQLFICRKIG